MTMTASLLVSDFGAVVHHWCCLQSFYLRYEMMESRTKDTGLQYSNALCIIAPQGCVFCCGLLAAKRAVLPSALLPFWLQGDKVH